MASTPGILTKWPWTPLGSFKHIMLAPCVIENTYSFIFKGENERNLSNFIIFPFMLWRMLHNQLWISLSRYRTAKGNNRIVDKPIEFDQVDRERNWDDQILFNAILFYIFIKVFAKGSHFPLWRTDGVILTALIHAGPVEFLYYWLHRALHHHYLYNRYHSHHHSSVATEPITSVTHPFAEIIAYFALFLIPLLTIFFTGTFSIAAYAGYITYIDLMNNMGHCNFELVPKWIFTIFPPLKYFMYTPSMACGARSKEVVRLVATLIWVITIGMRSDVPLSLFHSLHHTQFRTNYSLFMPIYDYIYGTTDKSSDTLYEKSLKRQEELPDVVHLTHLTTPESIYHLRLGFASLASKPHTSKWYLWLMWPVTLWSMMLTWIYGYTLVMERNHLDKLRLQTWAILKYQIQYQLRWQNESINSLIEEAIIKAEEKGAKVLSLGLLNQGEELNKYGGLYIHRHPQLKVKLVDGSSLAVAVVLNSIPKGTTEVVLRGNLTKVAYAITSALCQKGIQVAVLHGHEYEKLNKSYGSKSQNNLVLSGSYSHKVWLVGDGLTEEEQSKAPKETIFMPFSQFPPKKLRTDCFYHTIPAMVTPKSLENVDSCENWLPRRVMSAWRVAGIVHALEGWEEHECGHTMSGVKKVWEASLKHGFQPLNFPAQAKF